MSLDIFKEKGVPLDQQQFTWRDLVREPISKLDNDAFSRARIILMNGIESESNRFLHAFARMNRNLRRGRPGSPHRPSSANPGELVESVGSVAARNHHRL